MQQRDIGKMIIYTLFTLGLYSFYWFYQTGNGIRQLGYQIPSPIIYLVHVFISALSYGLVFITSTTSVDPRTTLPFNVALNIIYFIAWLGSLYWAYQYYNAAEHFTSRKVNKVVFFVVHIFGFGWVLAFVAQDAYNNVFRGTNTLQQPQTPLPIQQIQTIQQSQPAVIQPTSNTLQPQQPATPTQQQSPQGPQSPIV